MSTINKVDAIRIVRDMFTGGSTPLPDQVYETLRGMSNDELRGAIQGFIHMLRDEAIARLAALE